MTMPRGKTRCASRVSPAEKVTYCHPSYAQSVPSMARPMPERRLPLRSPGHSGCPSEKPRPVAVSATLMTRIAITLIAVDHPWTLAL